MLNKGQQEALEALMSGKNIFLSGEAGTGKSYVINHFLAEVEYSKNVIVCAPTGIAALNIGGATLHRTFDIPLEPISFLKGPLKTKKAIREADIIIIDEISMCRFDCFEYVAKYIRLAEKEAQQMEFVNANVQRRAIQYFRPKQLIVIGDFFQLPPVITEKDRSVLENYWGKYMRVGDGFAFQAPAWSTFNFTTVLLTEPIRQREDLAFVHNLNDVRKGTASSLDWFNKNASPERQMGIHLCPTNKAAESINALESEKLQSPSRTYHAKIKGIVNATDKPTTDTLELKEGMQVMTLINDSENRYKNGSIGIIKKLRKNSIEVTFGEMDVDITPHTWEVLDYDIEIDEKGESKIAKFEIGSFCQLPIRIAYALTIHKTQGQTYECANINPACFAAGQLYVALSRVKEIKNIHLISPIQPRHLICSQEVLNFYEHGIRIYEPVQLECKSIFDDRPDEEMCTLQIPKSARDAVMALLESRDWD